MSYILNQMKLISEMAEMLTDSKQAEADFEDLKEHFNEAQYDLMKDYLKKAKENKFKVVDPSKELKKLYAEVSKLNK